MTYEHGKAPADAPVTWRLLRASKLYWLLGENVHLVLDADEHEHYEMDAICRAFHLAKLAEEAADILRPLATHGATDPKEVANAKDWLARFDAAKGDA